MISVDRALAQIFDLAPAPQVEDVSLRAAAGRVLAKDVISKRAQPPFSASAMDGYAVAAHSVKVGATYTVIGEAAAGHAFDGAVSEGQAVRIFTGAPVPAGCDYIIIQEDVDHTDDTITVKSGHDTSPYVRRKGSDFEVGTKVPAPRRITSADLALIAAMNTPVVSVARKPVVAILSTGDELVYPGDAPKDDQIIASNTFGIAALVEEFGGIARVLPIARDTHASIEQGLKLAQDADILVTIGGASVGDHDLVAKVMQDAGGELDFYKIAMRPGKPLMAGRFGSSVMLGLPGNPVSAMVCAHIFLAPLINVCLGLPAAPRPEKHAPLAHDITGNGRREHYMRAQLKDGEIHVASRQDSGLLSVLAGANILIKRPIDAPPAFAGTPVPYIDLHRID